MKKIKYFIIIILTSTFFSACNEDFLETKPTDAVSDAVIIESTENAKMALNGIYRSFYVRYNSANGNTGLGSLYIQVEVLGEDVVMTDVGNGWFNNMYKWLDHRDETDRDNMFPWKYYYVVISNANVLINDIDKATGTQDEIDEIKGQALAIRAFAYYQLVQLYSTRYDIAGSNTQLGLPLALNNNQETYDGLARSTVEEVYTQINMDIDNAILLLENYNRSNRTHVNLDVAKGLKARIALTQGNWDEAARNAADIKANYSLMDSTAYAQGFNNELKDEFIWTSEILLEHSREYGNFGAFMSRNMGSNNVRGNPKAINSLLYDMIPASDVRKTLWDPTGLHENLPDGVTLSPDHKLFPYTNQKFIVVSGSDSRLVQPHMRAAEMYLIEAEALARDGQYGLAASVLYDLVSTRDAAYTLSTNTGQTLIDEILTQRRIELWGEGFRFYDLKRMNLPLDRTGANHSEPLAGSVMQVPAGDVRWEFLIPQDEIEANPKIIPNPY